MVFTIGMASASSEIINNGKEYNHITYDNKYYTLQEISSSKAHVLDGLSRNVGYYYSLKLKDSVKNTYKINSARVTYKYYSFDPNYNMEIKHITIKSKDKISISIKFPYDYINDFMYEIHSATVSFTKNGKKGTTDIVKQKYTWESNTVLNGKNAKIISKTKGGCEHVPTVGYVPITSYHKVKIDTKSFKYLIKSVKGYHNHPVNANSYSFTIKGNGKTTMIITVPRKYFQLYFHDLKITYY